MSSHVHMKLDKTKLDDIEYPPLRGKVKGTLDSLVEEIDGRKERVSVYDDEF